MNPSLLGLHFGSKKTGKISIVYEDLSKNSVFFWTKVYPHDDFLFMTSHLFLCVCLFSNSEIIPPVDSLPSVLSETSSQPDIPSRPVETHRPSRKKELPDLSKVTWAGRVGVSELNLVSQQREISSIVLLQVGLHFAPKQIEKSIVFEDLLRNSDFFLNWNRALIAK